MFRIYSRGALQCAPSLCLYRAQLPGLRRDPFITFLDERGVLTGSEATRYQRHRRHYARPFLLPWAYASFRSRETQKNSDASVVLEIEILCFKRRPSGDGEFKAFCLSFNGRGGRVRWRDARREARRGDTTFGLA